MANKNNTTNLLLSLFLLGAVSAYIYKLNKKDKTKKIRLPYDDYGDFSNFTMEEQQKLLEHFQVKKIVQPKVATVTKKKPEPLGGKMSEKTKEEQYEIINLSINNNVNGTVPASLLGNTQDPMDTANATTDYRWNLTAFNFTNENYILINYRWIKSTTFSQAVAPIIVPTYQGIADTLNKLNLGAFFITTSGGNTYLENYNEKVVFGEVTFYYVPPPVFAYTIIDPSFLIGSGFDNDVNAVVYGSLFFSGNFTTYNGIPANRIIKLNQDGSVDTSFIYGSGFNDIVYAMALQPNGKLVVAGNFTTYDGITCNGIVRLNADGGIDPSFNSGAGFSGGAVNSIAIQGNGDIICGGDFTSYRGTTANRIVRINTDGTLDNTFVYGSGFDATVNSVVSQTNEQVLVGGAFTTYDGVTCPTGIIRLNDNGTVDTAFSTNAGTGLTGANALAKSVYLSQSGDIYIGGDFHFYNGNQTYHIARINNDGTFDSTFNTGAGFDDNVFVVVEQGNGQIYVGGTFTTYQNAPALRIVRINTNGSIDTTWNTGSGFDIYVSAIAIQGDNGYIVCGGNFTTFDNEQYNRAVRLFPTEQYLPVPASVVDPTFDEGTGFNAITYCVNVESSGKIIYGGDFTTFNGTTKNGIVRLNSGGSIDSSFIVKQGFDAAPLSISVQSDDKIIVGGQFTSFDGQTYNRLIRLLSEATPSGYTIYNSEFNSGSGFDGNVNFIAVQIDGKIICVGDFTSYKGISANRIIRLNSDGSIDNTFLYGSGFNGAAYSIAIQSDGKIICVGGFDNYNGATAYMIVRLNKNGTIDNGFNSGSGFDILPLSVILQSDEKIIVVGNFTTYNSIPASNIIRLNSDGSTDNTFFYGSGFAGFQHVVYGIGIQSDGKIVCGGKFDTYNGTSVPTNIIRLNVDGSIDYGFVTNGIQTLVNSLAIQTNGQIIAVAGGLYNLQPIGGIIRFNSDGSRDNSFNLGSGFDNLPSAVYIQDNGKILCVGFFNTFNNQSANYIVRLNQDGSKDLTWDYGNGFDVFTNCVTVFNEKIYIGGYFNNFNGYPANHIVSLLQNPTIEYTQIDNTFNIGTGFDNYVASTQIQSDGKILCGGYFSFFNGVQRDKIIRLNSNGGIDDSYIITYGFDNNVYSITLQNDGNAIIGGDFSSFNFIPYNRLIRLLQNAAPTGLYFPYNSSFDYGNGFDLDVNAIFIQSDGKILCGGGFTSYNGVTANRIIRLNPNGSIDNTFVTGSGFDLYSVRAISVQSDGKIVCGGVFTSYNGTGANSIIRLNADGSIDGTFVYGSGFQDNFSLATIYSIAIQNDGKILVGGKFYLYNGTLANNIIRLNADGSIDGTFVYGTAFSGNVSVFSVAIQSDGKIVCGGSFFIYNGTSANNIIRLNSNGSVDGTFNYGSGFDVNVYSLAIQGDGKIVCGGGFTSYNGTSASKIIRLNSNGSVDNTFVYGSGFGGTVLSIAIQSDDKIIVGGELYSYNGDIIYSVVRLNTDGTLDSNWSVGYGSPNGVRIVSVNQTNGNIYLGGSFTSFNRIIANKIVGLLQTATTEYPIYTQIDTSFVIGTGFNNQVLSTAVQQDGKIICGGNFTDYNGNAVNHIARLLPNGTFDSSFIIGSGFNSVVYSVVVQSNGQILCGGGFTSYNGYAINYVARLNADGTLDTTWNIGVAFNSYIQQLFIQTNGAILFAGNFTQFNNQTYNYLIRLLQN